MADITARRRCRAAGMSPAPMLERAAKMAALPVETAPIVIADYGSSQGRNSLVPIAAAIEVLRERCGPEREISVVHTDVPENDFTVLFQTLLNDPASYLNNRCCGVRIGCGKVVLGAGPSLQHGDPGLEFMGCAMVEQGPWTHSRPGPSGVQQERRGARGLRQTSGKRLEEFPLGARTRALRRGRLVVLTMALDKDGEFGYRPLVDATMRLWLRWLRAALSARRNCIA